MLKDEAGREVQVHMPLLLWLVNNWLMVEPLLKEVTSRKLDAKHDTILLDVRTRRGVELATLDPRHVFAEARTIELTAIRGTLSEHPFLYDGKWTKGVVVHIKQAVKTTKGAKGPCCLFAYGDSCVHAPDQDDPKADFYMSIASHFADDLRAIAEKNLTPALRAHQQRALLEQGTSFQPLLPAAKPTPTAPPAAPPPGLPAVGTARRRPPAKLSPAEPRAAPLPAAASSLLAASPHLIGLEPPAPLPPAASLPTPPAASLPVASPTSATVPATAPKSAPATAPKAAPATAPATAPISAQLQDAGPLSAATMRPVQVGDRCTVSGLRGRADLNGRTCVLLTFSEDRWGIEVEGSKECVRVKLANLVLVEGAETRSIELTRDIDLAELRERTREALSSIRVDLAPACSVSQLDRVD